MDQIRSTENIHCESIKDARQRTFKNSAPNSNMQHLLGLAAPTVSVSAVSITNIQGTSLISPFNGKSISNVTGIVTAKVRAYEERYMAF